MTETIQEVERQLILSYNTKSERDVRAPANNKLARDFLLAQIVNYRISEVEDHLHACLSQLT